MLELASSAKRMSEVSEMAEAKLPRKCEVPCREQSQGYCGICVERVAVIEKRETVMNFYSHIVRRQTANSCLLPSIVAISRDYIEKASK